MASEIELIKQKLDIVDFIRSYLPLQPAGKNFRTLCPFHQERTPSFIVSPERQIWYCFGACHDGGDIVKFLMRYENLEFPEALQVLAERAGIEIRKISPQQQKEFGILYDIHQKAKEFFINELNKNSVAPVYLKERGLEPETVKEFELGFAPGGETLTLHLLNLGYDMNDIVRAGLSLKNVKGIFRDRFENRIIFPIFNNMGKVVAFTGRLMPELEKRAGGEALAKYLNSPETLIFNKSKILYGFHKSKPEIARTRNVFLVEGQMDVLMAWQAGVKQVVAVSGSALSFSHLQTLRRLAETVFLSFDKDEAGLKALERSVEILSPLDFHVKVIDLKEFKDPAEAVQKDPTFLAKSFSDAQPVFGYLFGVYLPVSQKLDLPVQKRILRKLLAIIKRIKSPIEQQAWVKNLAKHSGVSEGALIEELSMINIKETVEPSADFEAEIGKKERLDRIVEALVMFAVQKEKFWPTLKSHRQYLPAAFQGFVDNPASAVPDHLRLRAAYELGDKDETQLNEEFEDLLFHLKIESLKKERNKIKESMKLVQERGNDEELEEVLKAFHKVTAEIHELSKK